MTGYTHPDAVFTAPSGGVKIDPPYDPAFSARISNTRGGDGSAYAIAEDGTVLGQHWCSHRGYMRHDLHDRKDRLAAIREYGYRLVVLMGEGEVPPAEVLERNRLQAEPPATR